ncbi:adenylate kinase isoenzyme 1-like isoform X4 [Paramacrobiotus metropolitanus]|uniref:adenylate kinase isoenzyme 1-like isoform X4 n=1 Tax=Paramacrobiotus metropolitanus TaxID=2943436 RepID=UPI0024464B56|nr:adenylate kinase isoenzyme 1-like isoform X4 [Paramacrobiotus metropolitanus]
MGLPAIPQTSAAKVPPTFWSAHRFRGKQGSGKATVCHRLAAQHGISYVTIGQLLRDEASTNTVRGRALAQYVYAVPSKPVPKALMLELLKETISKLLYVHRPIVISGFPRNYDQAMELENLGLPMKHVIYLKVTNETAKSRIQRKNQYCEICPISPEEIDRRLTAFDQQTMSVIQLLDKEKRIFEIDANGDAEEMFVKVNALYETWLRLSNQGAEFQADPTALAGQQSLATTHTAHTLPPAVRLTAKPARTVELKPTTPVVKERRYGLSQTKVAFR